MVNSEEFSERLQKIMRNHSLNASSFAEHVGVGRSSMSHILSGRNKPSLDFVLAVLKNFEEVDLYWLLNGRGKYPKEIISNQSVQREDKSAVPLPPESEKPDVAVNKSATQDQISHTKEKDSLKNLGKNISRVILFYEDGTFENFIP